MCENATLLVVVPNAQSNTGSYWAYEDFTHFTLFTSGSVPYVLKAAGYDKISFVDRYGLDGTPLIRKLFKSFFLFLYCLNYKFWNYITSSFFHQPSPQIFTYDIKVLAR